jgi:hypothetical protein
MPPVALIDIHRGGEMQECVIGNCVAGFKMQPGRKGWHRLSGDANGDGKCCSYTAEAPTKCECGCVNPG